MSFLQKFVTVCLTCLLSSSVIADVVLLDDGSRLKGSVKQIANGTLIMDTAFAGEVNIELARVDQLTTENKHYVQLHTGDRVAGRLTVSEAGKQQLTDTAFGTIALDTNSINGLWGMNEKRPVVDQIEQEHQQEIASLKQEQEQEVSQMKSGYQAEITELRDRKQELEDPWSGNIGLGILGAQGNTERFGIQGRGEAYRETDFDRLALYIEGNYQREDGQETVNEVLAGASLERDFTPRWFAFGNTDFEIDEFENLELRALATTGVGYFFVKQPDFKFKGLAGAGYQFESFTDGTTAEEPLGQLGYDLTYQYNSWLKILHDFTYYPAFTDPAADYRLVTNLAGEMPLSEGKAWKLRAGIRNQYDSMPAAGAKSTDTTYRLNLVYDWK